MPCTPFVSPIAADKALPSPLAFQYNLSFPKPGAGCWAVGHVAAPAGFPGFSSPFPGSRGTCSQTLARGMLSAVWAGSLYGRLLQNTACPISGEWYVAVTVKSSVCFVGLNCKCFEGGAWLLCMHVWVCIFIQFIMWHTQELLCAKPWLSVLWKLREMIFLIQRDEQWFSSEHWGYSGTQLALDLWTQLLSPSSAPQYILGTAVRSMALCPQWCWDGVLDQLRKKKLHCTLCQLLTGMPSLTTSHP